MWTFKVSGTHNKHHASIKRVVRVGAGAQEVSMLSSVIRLQPKRTQVFQRVDMIVDLRSTGLSDTQLGWLL